MTQFSIFRSFPSHFSIQPMGWMTWERFRCITDCEKYPKECISENLIMETADIMASEGLALNYHYFLIKTFCLQNFVSTFPSTFHSAQIFGSGLRICKYWRLLDGDGERRRKNRSRQKTLSERDELLVRLRETRLGLTWKESLNN